VLIDGLVGSQASSFASTVDHFKRGTLIGEETGGNYNGNTGGTFANLILPHSKLQIQMFVFKIIRFTDTINDSKGIIPEYKVEPSIEDKLTCKDVELMTVLKMIKQSTQKNKNYIPSTKRQARHSSL
jgi:C-terminal processing protease CtpA/Prc